MNDRDEMTEFGADDELVAEFVEESRDYISAAEAALLSLEEDPTDEDAIGSVFRAFHTVKGVASLLGLTTISEFAHHAESLMAKVGRERHTSTLTTPRWRFGPSTF